MAGVNKMILIGNVGNDPDVRYAPSGDAIANLSVATSEKWTDKTTGEIKEATEWHKLVAYKKTAELIAQYVRKGDKIYAEGSLQTRKWQDQDGKDRWTTEIKVKEVQFLSEKKSGGFAPKNDGQPKPSATQDVAFEDADLIPF